jgi:small conductance mechanosensitive channel
MEFNFQPLLDFAYEYGPKLIGALLILIIGKWVIKMILKAVQRIFRASNFENSLKSFFESLISVLLQIILIITVLGMIGVEMTSFIALLGAAGLALGMALSGTLQNFAGGVMLLFFKPFKVGDLIESQGHIGTVKEIQIFVTMLLTPENKTVFLPNGAVSNNEITNYATQGKIRVDLVVGISYNDSIDKAKSIIAELMSAHKYIISEPKAFVGVLELGDSSVNLAVRPYCKPQDYWKVYFELLEQIKLALDENGIEIPFPQRVVHQINKS